MRSTFNQNTLSYLTIRVNKTSDFIDLLNTLNFYLRIAYLIVLLTRVLCSSLLTNTRTRNERIDEINARMNGLSQLVRSLYSDRYLQCKRSRLTNDLLLWYENNRKYYKQFPRKLYLCINGNRRNVLTLNRRDFYLYFLLRTDIRFNLRLCSITVLVQRLRRYCRTMQYLTLRNLCLSLTFCSRTRNR